MWGRKKCNVTITNFESPLDACKKCGGHLTNSNGKTVVELLLTCAQPKEDQLSFCFEEQENIRNTKTNFITA
jgi:hypothetical protein